MKRFLIPSLIIVLIFIAGLTACRQAGDDAETTTDAAPALESVSVPFDAVETSSRSLSKEERMAEIVSSIKEEDYSVLDITVDFWYPKDLKEATDFAESMEYDKREVETENSTEVDTYWIDSQTDFPIAQRLVDAKGRVSEATRNNLDGTYYRIKYLYDTDDGGEADPVMVIEVIDTNADPKGESALVTKSYTFQFYPNNKICTATLQYYDENGEQGDFFSYTFDPDGNIVQYLDTGIYTELLQAKILANLGGALEEVASSIDVNELIEQAGIGDLAGLAGLTG